ncbi:hypothetical protein D3C86_2026690 [compost metagenome]
MLVPLTVPSDTPSRNTSYCVTPTLSVAASQLRTKPLSVMPDAFNPVGTLGDVLSASVFTVTALLSADQFPAASTALTVML